MSNTQEELKRILETPSPYANTNALTLLRDAVLAWKENELSPHDPNDSQERAKSAIELMYSTLRELKLLAQAPAPDASPAIMESDPVQELIEWNRKTGELAQEIIADWKTTMAACKKAEIELRAIPFPTDPQEESHTALLSAITAAESSQQPAQTPEQHEQHRKSEA